MSENADDVTAVDQTEQAQAEKERIDLQVDITDAGPCRKHLKVSVPRAEVDRYFDKEFSGLVKKASVPGFRPGKTPRRLIERRFRKDVQDQVKSNLLAQSLEQIGEEQKLEPLSQPELDITKIELPEEGDFVYEFEVEVRPDFPLPKYQGLKINRPVKEFGDKDIDAGLLDMRRRYATLETKDGAVEPGDYVVADVRFLDGKDVIKEAQGLTVSVENELLFNDGKIANFAEGIKGAKVGDSREFKVALGDTVTQEELRGKQLDAVFVISEIKAQKLPELNADFYSMFGAGDEGELRDVVRLILEQRLKFAQSRQARDQVVNSLIESTQFELPPELLRRQAERTFRRELVELRSAGYDDKEIVNRVNRLKQNSLDSTARSLREQFILQRIAEAEDIKVDESDLENEVRSIADRTNTTVRRARAQIEKEGLWEAIATQVLEQKTLDRILSFAEQQDVPYEEEQKSGSSGLDESAVPVEEPKSASEPESAEDAAS